MKNLKSLGMVLNKTEQKSIMGSSLKKPCPCSSRFTPVAGGGNHCNYPAVFPAGLVCHGTIQNGLCCV